MLEFLNHLFGCICGQNPDHTWSPGGVLLPFCQRCMGLYVGAFVAAALHLALRPVPTNRWLWLNGGFLLFMVPFGFHWLPQGAVLRTITGVLFGFGLVAFLSLTLRSRRREEADFLSSQKIRLVTSAATISFWFTLPATLALVPWLGANGNAFAADSLKLSAALGAFMLSALALANVALAMRGLIRWARQIKPSNPEQQVAKF